MINFKERESKSTDIINRIFENRNITEKDKILNPKEKSITCPFIYTNMELGIQKILETISNNEKITLIVDSDVDGYCSSAMIYNYLCYVLGYENITYLIHKEKVHGLTIEMMQEVLKEKPKLLIIPDAGSNDFEQHFLLKENNIDILVIDHHHAERISEDAIVINNQLDTKGNKTLSGGGMVLKLIEGLDKHLNLEESKKFYDLAATSLVADAMSMLEEETRFYVLEGLKNMRNPLLKRFVQDEENINFDTISFKIAPSFNALIRIGEQMDKVRLFEALCYKESLETITLRGQGLVEMELKDYMIKITERARAKQNRVIKSILENKETILIEEDLPFGILIHDNMEAKSLNGLMAMKVAENRNKPILSVYKDKNIYFGSGRSKDDFKNFRDYLKECNLFDLVAGHESAFGVSFKEENLYEIINYHQHKILDVNNVIDVEKAYINNVSSFDIATVDEMSDLWSKGFEEPIFYIKLSNITKDKISIIGKNKNTIKIKHDYVEYVKFNSQRDLIANLLNNECNDIEIIGKFKVNRWNGYSTAQVIIEKIEFKNNNINNWSNFNAFG